MAKNLYANLQVVFPELKHIEPPEERDNFDAFIQWLNDKNCNIQRIEPQTMHQHGLAQCHRLKQLNLDVAELENQIQAEIESMQSLYEDDDDREAGSELEMYHSDLDAKLLLNILKSFVEPYGLTVLMIEFDELYWMLVPDQPELIAALIAGFNQLFGDVQAMSQIE